MPSSTRQITSDAVRNLRDLQTSLQDRRCHDLLMVTAAEAIVRSSEALHAGVARLDEDLVVGIRDRARAAIASLATLDLQGDAFGVEQIKDDVGRLICGRQLPKAYLCHLLAATITGVEQGLRELLLGTATTSVEQPPVSPKQTRPPRRITTTADRLPPGLATMPVASTAMSPIPDTAAADLLARLSSATATGSGSSSGRIEIEADTEGI